MITTTPLTKRFLSHPSGGLCRCVPAVGLSPGARAQKLTATAALPAKQLGPIAVPLTTTDGATYSASGVVLPSAGRWTITLTVTTSEFDAVVADAKIRLY